MDELIYILTASKFLEICGCNKGAAIYSILPMIDKKPEYYKGLYGNMLKNQPVLLDSALEIFAGKRIEVAKGSYAYTRIKEEKESFFNLFGQAKQWTNIPSMINNDKLDAALSLVCHSYVHSFFYPTQFFLPHSSVCSGHWDFWDKINYLELIEKINQKRIIQLLTKKLLKSNVWKTKFQPNDFPEIVKRRLLKGKLLEKKLDPNAMIKAMIIRMGELAAPSINYEVIDFSIRSFFTYLGVRQYLRVDREIEFLRRLEKEMKKILAGI